MSNHRLQHTRLHFDAFHTYQRENEKKRKVKQVKINMLAIGLLVALYIGVTVFIS